MKLMKTTFFKPSIHGWPFGNSWTYTVPVLGGFSMGFCGGMCWIALKRFFHGICIPRDIQAPQQGDTLYNEIYDEQVDSLPGGTVYKIYEWQQSPDLSHIMNIHHSLGYKTQQEWVKVKDCIDQSKPVTLTLVTSSNDGNVFHLSNNHRVVAYAYDERPLYANEWVHGDPDSRQRAQISVVSIQIYDPNHPNDDNVWLTFYRNAPDAWIKLKHSDGRDVHGFFLDDRNRNYVNVDNTDVWIDECVQTGIRSANRADYNLTFSWRCRFIPYFSLQIDGINWNYNSAERARYNPINQDDKQCQIRNGSLTLNLQVPRASFTVAVRLLGTDEYLKSLWVDAQPAIVCFPYVRNRANSDELNVCDTAINFDTDLFIKDQNPTQAIVQQLDTSPFRWITHISTRAGRITPQERDPLKRTVIQVIDKYYLGNIQVPILGNIIEKNLAVPTQTWGVVKIIRGGQTTQNNIAPLNASAQAIFNGFTNNPTDYENDTTVEFTYKSRDKFGIEVQGQTMFFGKSIIFTRFCTEYSILDPKKIAQMEAIAHKLIELGLISTVIELPQRPPPPIPILMPKLQSHPKIQGEINKTLKALMADQKIWKNIKLDQSRMLKADREEQIWFKKLAQTGLKVTNRIQEEEQRKYDALMTNMFADLAIKKLLKDPDLMKDLKNL